MLPSSQGMPACSCGKSGLMLHPQGWRAAPACLAGKLAAIEHTVYAPAAVHAIESTMTSWATRMRRERGLEMGVACLTYLHRVPWIRGGQ